MSASGDGRGVDSVIRRWARVFGRRQLLDGTATDAIIGDTRAFSLGPDLIVTDVVIQDRDRLLAAVRAFLAEPAVRAVLDYDPDTQIATIPLDDGGQSRIELAGRLLRETPPELRIVAPAWQRVMTDSIGTDVDKLRHLGELVIWLFDQQVATALALRTLPDQALATQMIDDYGLAYWPWPWQLLDRFTIDWFVATVGQARLPPGA